ALGLADRTRSARRVVPLRWAAGDRALAARSAPPRAGPGAARAAGAPERVLPRQPGAGERPLRPRARPGPRVRAHLLWRRPRRHRQGARGAAAARRRHGGRAAVHPSTRAAVRGRRRSAGRARALRAARGLFACRLSPRSPALAHDRTRRRGVPRMTRPAVLLAAAALGAPLQAQAKAPERPRLVVL